MTSDFRERHGDGASGEISFTLRVEGARTFHKVGAGTTVRQFLSKQIKHNFARGLAYRLNNKRLAIDRNGELIDDEVLTEGAVLLIEQSFTGGI